MKYDILIPTCRDYVPSVDLLQSLPADARVIVSGFPVSAAVNRNWCLMDSSAEYLVMMDDDISGFAPGWADRLVSTLVDKPDVVMTSARLTNVDGSPACMMSIDPDLTYRYQQTQALPSACIAFRNDGTRFDENFIGSSWEDTDFCVQLAIRYPCAIFVIDNEVKVVHDNEMKNGNPRNFAINKKYFQSKYPQVVV